MTEPGGGADIVTLLFTDLVGSTELLQSLGDDPAETVRRAHFGLLRDVVAAHGGHEVKNLGDGLMVVFGSALDALRSAITIQRAVRRHNATEPGHPFQIRVGLHAGEPVRDGDDYFGTPVVVAKRLCDAARGGQILASGLLAGLVGSRGGFTFRPVGPLKLKGLTQPVVTVELAWEAEVEAEAVAAGAAGRGGPPPFVGLRLLGPLQVVYGDAAPGGPPGGWIIDIGSAKQRAVLAVLGLHLNEVVSRDLLVDRLWGDRPPTSATVTLRSLVSRLRKALDGAAVGLEIVTREPGWTLRGEANAVDAAQFTALTAEARLLLAGGEPAAAALCWRKALGLWRGAALGDVVDAGYLAAEATRLDEARLDAVEDLADAELASGWAADALARLEPHIAGHPLRERSWGELMLALYHLGRQAEAVRAYQRLRAVLREELGLDPTPALADLEARILRHDPALGPPPAAARVESAAAAPPTPAAGLTAATAATPAPFSAGSPERTPFVGRVAELAVLSTALERARAGSGGMMLIGGEPGIGKTRLAEEAAAEAVAAGMGVLVGHSYEIAGAAPYVAVVEILEAALAAAPSAEAFVADVLGDAAPEVARLLPRVRRRFPDLPAPLELPPAQERLYLFRCLTDILARLAGACPTLVVLDDLQWADDATLLFVEHLAPQLAGLPLLVVATYRDTDVGRPLARTFGELHRRRLAGRISLAALTPVEAGELVAGLAGQDPPAELVDALHAASDGNVFFLEEIVRDLAESGRAFDDTGRFRTGVDVGDLGLPEGVRLVIERRLDRLSEPARAALAAAAVSGRVFSVALLQALIALDGDEVLDIVDEAEQAVLIAASGNDDEFLFAHELIRQTLVAGLSGTRRRRLHARSAEALERVHGHDVWAVAATIAHHLLEAGPAADPKRTFHYLKTAAESAMETSAFEEAVRHFESALLLPDAATARALTDLRVGLGRAHRSIGNSDIAIGHWRDAIDSYAALGDVEDAAELCAELAWHLCWAARWPEAKEVTDRGLAALGDRQGPARVALLISSAFACVIGEQYEAAEQRVDTAVEEAESLGDPHVVGRAQWAKATADWCVTRYNEAAQRGLRAAALQKEIGAVWDRTQTLLYVQLALHPLGRWDEAASTDDEVGPLAARLGHHLALCLGRRERAARERNSRPDFAHYREFARADLELNRETSLGWVGQSYAFLALADFWEGHWPEALRLAREATEQETASIVTLWSWAVRLLITAYAGHAGDTQRLFQELAPRIPAPGQAVGLGPSQLIFSAVEALAVAGQRNEAAALYPLVIEAINRGTLLDGYLHGRQLHMLAGIAAGAGGRYEQAERHFKTALAEAERIGQRMERPDILRFYAAMLAERAGPGDTGQAQSMLAEAAATFAALGMPRHVDMVHRALNSLGGPSGTVSD